jgi:hypothetical protein
MDMTPPTSTEATGVARNVVLVVVDQLDDDPATRNAAPSIEGVAARGARFGLVPDGATSLASVGAVLSSTPTSMLEIGGGIGTTLSPHVWTLADVMDCAGVRAGAFLANGYLHGVLARGWSRFHEAVREGRAREARAIARDAIAWLDEEPRERFFLYVHFIDAHLPPSASTADDVERERLHLAGMREADDALSELRSELDARGHGTDTLWVITSTSSAPSSDGPADQPTTRLPLVIAGPGAPRPMRRIVSRTDIAPTILEAMAIDIPRSFDGTSLGASRLHVLDRDRLAPRPFAIPDLWRETCLHLVAIGYTIMTRADCERYPSEADAMARAHDELAPALCPMAAL